MTKPKLIVALAVLCAVGTLGAQRFPGPDYKEEPDVCASPYAQPGGTLVYAGNNPPKSFNGYLDNNTFTSMIFGLLYPSMLNIDPRTGDYGPGLADWWEISEDKLLYTFHIDERAVWSDGSPVTAHDVKATFDAVTSPKSLSGQYKVLFADVKSPRVIDDKTIVFPCARVHWRNFGNIGGSLAIMPKKLLDRAREKCVAEGRDPDMGFNELNFDLPIVGGPYRILDHKEGLNMTLQRRPDWWCFKTPMGQGVYNFDKIRIRFFMDQNNAFEAFKKGEVDVYAVYSARVWNAECVGERFEKNWVVKQNVHNHEPVGFQGLAINMRRKPYDDVRVRKALAHLFDRRRMVRSLMTTTNAQEFQKEYEHVEKYEQITDRVEREIITYLSRITSRDNGEAATRQLQTMFRTISHIELIGDGNMELAKILKAKKEKNLWFNQELRDRLGGLFDLVEQALYVMITNLENPTAEGVERSRGIEEQINLVSARLRSEQLQEAQEQDYKYMAGIAFIEMVVECEKLGDAAVHISVEQAEAL